MREREVVGARGGGHEGGHGGEGVGREDVHGGEQRREGGQGDWGGGRAEDGEVEDQEEETVFSAIVGEGEGGEPG